MATMISTSVKAERRDRMEAEGECVGAGLLRGRKSPKRSTVGSRRLGRAESEADDGMGAGFALPDIGAAEAGLRLRPIQPDAHHIHRLRQSMAAHDDVHLPEAVGGRPRIVRLPGVTRVQVAEVTGLSALVSLLVFETCAATMPASSSTRRKLRALRSTPDIIARMANTAMKNIPQAIMTSSKEKAARAEWSGEGREARGVMREA